VPQAGDFTDSSRTFRRKKLFAYLKCGGKIGKSAGDGECLAQAAEIQGDGQPVAY
jgi:hypothetical protein